MSNFYGQYVGFGAGGGSSDPLGGFHGWGYQFGFVHGGPTSSNTIEKISFASDGGGIDHGNLNEAKNRSGGQSSLTNGYSSGGFGSPDENISKFAFASNTTASDHGDISVGRRTPSGTSSTTHGFNSSGNN